ncbi:hypothetical protein F442_02653 [Phytophthora nicotianae P10297]|uniref:Uncharacterized protein n=1 Tax=Phytophthora nicotianae P10297 TaxID=1317064 RepID=W2ZZE8_PHYNI|nr:hypothetical protein F442_02653 [Phytophthora nicotianae P10297]
MEEPVRQLVLELTTQAARQLESRVQSLVTNTKSEMNLQIQRQAGATSVLREPKLQKQQMRFKHRSNRIDEAWLKTSIQDVLLNNPDLVGHERQEQSQQSSTVSKGDKEHKEYAEQLNATLERSIGAAATTIGNAINGGMRCITKSSLRRDHSFEDSDSDDDVWMTPKDRQMENRMKEAWRNAYLCSKPDHVSPEANSDHEGKSSRDNRIENKPEVLARSYKDSEGLVSSPQTQLPFTGGAAFDSSVLLVVPPTQTQIFVQNKTHHEHRLSELRRRQCLELEQLQQDAPLPIQYRGRHRETHPPVPPRQSGEHRHQVQRHHKQAHTNRMQRLVNDLQQEVTTRAELAAQRYSSNN